MSLEQEAEAIAKATMAMKERMFREGGHRDSPPILGVMLKGWDEFSLAPPEIISLAWKLAGGDAPTAVKAVIESAPPAFEQDEDAEGPFPGFHRIFLAVDGYTTTAESVDDYQRGDMEQDFKSNPASTVMVVLTVTVIGEDLVGGSEMAMARCPYVVTDGGVMEFKPIELASDNDDNKIGGAVSDVMREAFTSANSG